MRCSRRSTTWRASRLATAVVAAGLAWWPGPAAAGLPDELQVRAAIVRAVQARMGLDAVVTVSDTRLVPAGAALPVGVEAVPDPGSRTGGVVRFTVRAAGGRRPGRHLGRAEAVVHVAAPHLVAARDLVRGSVLTGADARALTGDVGRVALKRLPAAAEGARLCRDVGRGERLLATMLALPALVRSGDEVTTVVRLGGLQASGLAVAVQSGGMGAVIRLVTKEGHRVLRGRVVGPQEVEVLHGS